MNPAPALCVIHEAIGHQGAIARVAMDGVQTALKQGWRVSVAAKLLDVSLVGEVEWLKLFVPPRGFALKWLSAGGMMRRAIGSRRFDVIHTHQPQAIPFADVFQCHYLTAAALEGADSSKMTTARQRLSALQERAVAWAEDSLVRRRNPRCRVIFNSDKTAADFARFHGRDERAQTLALPCPPARSIDAAARNAARRDRLPMDRGQIVIGFLGGTPPRKGLPRLLQAMRGEPDLFLLAGGPGLTEGANLGLGDRGASAGYVTDLAAFFAACDLLAVPSHYEPLGLVALEAVAHGVPVIATDEVGALAYLLKYRAGARWDGRAGLGNLAAEMMRNHEPLLSGCAAMTAALSPEDYSRRLAGVWETVLEEKRRSAVRGRASLARGFAKAHGDRQTTRCQT